MKQAKEICPTTTSKLMSEGALMVDVRSRDEVLEATYDVEPYLNIPLDQLEERIDEIPKDKPVVMVCRSGGRSLRATYYLMNAGYENVVNMDGGIIKWVSKNFPTRGDISIFTNDSSCDCSTDSCC